MASVSFTCPNCAKVLRTANRPASGKKIKCPGCEEVFVPEFADEEAVAEKPPQKRTRVQAKTKAEPTEDEDAKPTRKKAREEDEDENEEEPADATPRRKKARVKDDEDDDDDADDDLPRKKKKAKKKSGALVMTLAIFGIAFVLLGCGLLGVGAWVWPGFLIGATNNNDIQAFLPSGVNQMYGLDAKALSQQGQLDFALKWLEKSGPMKDRPLPAEVMELIRDSEKVIICQGGAVMRPVTYYAILAKDKSAVDKFKGTVALGAPERLEKRHIVYRPGKKAGGQWPLFVAVPGDRLVLLNDLQEDALVALLKRGEKPDEQPSGVLKLSKAVEQAPVWTAWIPQTLGAMKQLGKQGMPNLDPTATAFLNAKGGSMAAEFANDHWKVHVRIECANDADATHMKSGLEAMKTLLAFGEVPPSLRKDIGTMVCEPQGATLSVRIQMSPQTIDEMGKAPKMPF